MDARKRTRRARGLTLVELMVVVGVIGILSTAIITRSIGARRDAADARGITLLDTMRNVVIAYYDRYGEWPPSVAQDSEVQWDAWVTKINSKFGDLQLPWGADAHKIFTTFFMDAGVGGDPYTIRVYITGGNGGYYGATPYRMWFCTGGSLLSPTNCVAYVP